MRTGGRDYRKTLRAGLLLAGLFWLGAGVAQAEPATALNCDGCVSSKDIKNGGVKTYDIRAGAINTSRLADDAVTKRKIADGAVGAAQLGLAHTVYLEDSGSDTDNCYKLLDVLDGLAGPAAVVLGPGTFDCQKNNILLPSRVSLIGAGQNLTTITGSNSGSSGLVRLSGGSALTDLTVINDDHAGPVSGLTAVFVKNAENWRLRNVTAKATNGYIQSIAVWIGFAACSGEMTNVTAAAEGSRNATGLNIDCTDGFLSATNVTASAIGSSGASLFKYGDGIFIARNSSFRGLDIDLPPGGSSSSGTLRLVSSEVSGDLPFDTICIGVYDETGTALTNGTAGLGGCI